MMFASLAAVSTTIHSLSSPIGTFTHYSQHDPKKQKAKSKNHIPATTKPKLANRIDV
jgi:hypothetical protein